MALLAGVMRGTRAQEVYEIYAYSLPQPFDLVRQHTEILVAGGMILYIILRLSDLGRALRVALECLPCALLLLLQVLDSVKVLAINGSVANFVPNIAVTVVMFTVYAALVPLGENRDKLILYLISATALIVLGGSLYCYLVAPNTVYFNGRFMGIAYHPVMFGQLMAVGVGAFFHLSRIAGQPAARWVSLALAIAFAVMIVISGTRTGAGLVVVFFAIYSLKSRRGRMQMILIGLAASLAGGALAMDLHGLGAMSDLRVISTEDTRGRVTREFISAIVDNPLIGVWSVETPTSNSILLCGARLGVGGLIVALIVYGLSWRMTIRLLRSPHVLPGSNRWFVVTTFAVFLVLVPFDGMWLQKANAFTGMFYALAASVYSMNLQVFMPPMAGMRRGPAPHGRQLVRRPDMKPGLNRNRL